MAILIVPAAVKKRLWDRIDRDRREGKFPSPANAPDKWKALPEAYMIHCLLDATEEPLPPLPIEIGELGLE